MGSIIAVTSGKGGVGKSTFSVGLGLAAASQGSRVLLIDMDAGLRCLDLLLGVSEKLVFDLSDALDGRALDACVLEVPTCPGLSLLPAPGSRVELDPERFGALVQTAAEAYDAVILDFPAGSDCSPLTELPRSSQFLCITNPDPVCIRDAASVGASLQRIGKTGQLIINKYRYYSFKNGSFSSIDDIINTAGMKLTGIVPFSERLAFAFFGGKFPKKGIEYKAFCRIFGRLTGKNIPLPKLKKFKL